MNLYASPLRVYLVLGLLAVLGVYCGSRLPVSLFPAANHPEVSAGVTLGSYSAEEFLNTFGKDLEERLRSMQADGLSVEKLTASYSGNYASYYVTFNWGTKPTDALRETQSLVTAFSARFPQELRDNTWVWMQGQNSGFFAASLYSDKRSLQELYNLVEPVLGPRIAAVGDARDPHLWNPASEEIRIELKPEALASLHLFPRNVHAAIAAALSGRSGGEIPLGDDRLSVELPRQVRSVASLSEITMATPGGRNVSLSEIARIDRGPKSNDRQSFSTGGNPSLILWGAPKPGGNVKRMSEDLNAAVQSALKDLPPDIQYKVLVDPSEFIRAAVRNVFTEVFLAALLAVGVLFIFIGSPRNILTAAIEIPLSIVLAFILMRIFGMNLNLISLGGLALSAGMNVDASVVVLENIFRHFELSPGPHDFKARVRLISEAVSEVRFPILASTLVSLVVFLPLALTSGLSQGILGDLALAVVFSHGFSAVVALVLVPTIRLQLMAKGNDHPTPSPFEKPIRRLEALYSRSLRAFLNRPRAQAYTFAALPVVLLLLLFFVVPRLPKELVGMPDTDRLVLGINTEGNTLVRQMENVVELTEKELLQEYGKEIASTFSQTHGANSGSIILRLHHKNRMNAVWKDLEKKYVTTPLVRYSVSPWNPSELPLPDFPHLLMLVRGGTPEQRRLATKGIVDTLRDKKVYPNVYSNPGPNLEYSVRLAPNPSQSEALRASGGSFGVEDIADLVRVATTGRWAGNLPEESRSTEIQLFFPKDAVKSVEDIGAIPIGVAGKMVPLRALTEVKRVQAPPRILREDARPLFRIEARRSRGEDASIASSLEQAKVTVADWKKENPRLFEGVTVTFEDPAPQMTEAIHQLTRAMLLSLALILVTLVFQFGTLIEPLLVMVALPLGYIGVLLSLYCFGSTLSLNSVLGVILLNGIAVANSILLVDFTKRLAAAGREPGEAAVEAASVRLRPILITSLTTILGMMPLALGLGEGGRILQPLGIAVAGGMWVSLALTLYVVPCLHTLYLRRAGTFRWPAWRFPRLVPFVRRSAVVWLTLLTTPAFAVENIDYGTALATLVDRHPEVAQAAAQVEVVRNRNLPGRLAMLPSISLFARQDIRNELGINASRSGVGASLDVNLFRFGSDWNGMRAAWREVEAEEQQLAATRLRIEGVGVDALNQFLSTSFETEILNRVLQWREHLLQIGKKRFDRGLIAKQEVDKINIDLENDRALLRDSQAALVRSEANIDQLVGHHLVKREWPWKDKLSRKVFPFAEDGEAHLQDRPDWKVAERRHAAARARASQSWGRIFPSLDFNVSYGYFQSASMGPQYSTAIVLSVPLFDRLQSYGAYAAQADVATQAELEMERVKRLARSEWDSSKAALPLSIETALARDKTLVVARGLYDDNVRRFERGLIEANDLSVDQQRLLASEQLAVRGWSAAHGTFARLCFARGLRIKECL